LEKEQIRRRKVIKKEKTRVFTTKTKYRDITATTISAPSLAKEAEKFLIADANKVCSNRKS